MILDEYDFVSKTKKTDQNIATQRYHMKNDFTEFIVNIYRRRAKGYDFRSYLYYLIAYRLWAYRKRAVQMLQLKPGDTVVEIGCGTGLNFPLLQKAVGKQGKIIGVDATDAMLNKAKEKVEKKGWENVDLVPGNALDYQFPAGVNGIISTFALSLMPDFEKIILNGINALAPRGRWVVMELKVPSNCLSNLLPVFIPIVKAFGVTRELIEQRPWEIIWNTFKQNLQKVNIMNLYLGTTFILWGEAEVKRQK